MKLTKMSLVATLLVSSSVFAIENTKMSGDAKLFYSASNFGKSDMFSKDGAAADAALNLNVSSDLLKNDLVSVNVGAGYSVLSTLGLENNLVSAVWGSAHGVTTSTGANYGGAFGGAKVENTSWMNEAWIAISLNEISHSSLKLGRMKLDTPLAFTETWSIEENSFEAALVINQDIPDTTLIAGYIGNGNGVETFGQDINGTVIGQKLAAGAVVNEGGKFTTYGKDGAYTLAVINNSYKPLTVQGWFYNVTHVATAFWMQADLDANQLGVEGLTAGLQYSGINLTQTNTSAGVYALMAAYNVKNMFNVKLAYSQVSKNASVGYNTATGGQSKLYTEAWWNYGYITRADTSALNLTVKGQLEGYDLGFYFTQTDSPMKSEQDGSITTKYHDLTEVTLTASRTFGPLDATVAYVYTDAEDQNIAKNATKGTAYSMLQAYLTVNF